MENNIGSLPVNIIQVIASLLPFRIFLLLKQTSRPTHIAIKTMKETSAIDCAQSKGPTKNPVDDLKDARARFNRCYPRANPILFWGDNQVVHEFVYTYNLEGLKLAVYNGCPVDQSVYETVLNLSPWSPNVVNMLKLFYESRGTMVSSPDQEPIEWYSLLVAATHFPDTHPNKTRACNYIQRKMYPNDEDTTEREELMRYATQRARWPPDEGVPSESEVDDGDEV